MLVLIRVYKGGKFSWIFLSVWEMVLGKNASFRYFSAGDQHLFAFLAGRRGVSSQV